jgi:N utilization substance protein A
MEIEFPKRTDVLGRIAAQTAKQVIFQKVREAEREHVFAEYNDRIGEVINSVVKRFENGELIVEIGRIEAVLPRKEQSRAESYAPGERIRAVIKGVSRSTKGPQIVLSRTDPRLLVKLFEMEVPEIYDGTVVIKNAVRAPGERAKVAVYSRERDVDPGGACVGMKGSRVQSIIRELRGEKLDINEHSDDLVTFAQSALPPARITRVSVTHHGEVPHLDVIVEDEQLSLAIGKRGQNVRLASELIGARIDIKSESDVKDEVAGALARMLQTAVSATGSHEGPLDLTAAPGIGPKTAESLTAAGFGTLKALRDAGLDALVAVAGVGAQTATALKEWAEGKAGEETQAAPEGGLGLDAAAAAAEKPATMGDEDFMAALSRAFQESESLRQSVADRTEGDEAAEHGSVEDGDGEGGAGEAADGESRE